VQPFTKLKVWRKARSLSLSTYLLTSRMPASERFGLVSQMRRAAVSIAGNIAEGAGRSARGDFLRHLHIASGSAAELQSHVLLARDLGLLSQEQSSTLLAQIEEVKRMLVGLLRVVSSRQ
jgi:four helix bundle protein